MGLISYKNFDLVLFILFVNWINNLKTNYTCILLIVIYRVPARLGRVELRRLIDSHKDEKDFVKATELLERGEQQVLSYWFFNNNRKYSVCRLQLGRG